MAYPFPYSHSNHFDNQAIVPEKEWRAPQGPIDLKPDPELDFHGRQVLEKSCTARQMAEKKGQKVTMYGYLITLKPVKTVKGEMMTFGCFIDHEGYFLDTIHFPQSLKDFNFRGSGVYRLEGKVVDEFGFMSLEVQKMHKLPRQADPRSL